MGRAGGGSRSGGSRSSSSHSSSRSSSGHRVSSSSGGSRRAGSGTTNRSGGSRNSVHVHNNYYSRSYYGGYNGGYRRATGCSVWVAVFFVFIILLSFLSVKGVFNATSGIPNSTVNREKVSVNASFQNSCIIDELGWFDNVSRTSKNLQYFYNKTGVQPFVYLKSYDPSLTTDDQKEAYANQWYEDNIKDEGTYLFVYFAEEDTDNDVGYMCSVNGLQITSVMDAEAVDIFWSYVDSYWYSDLSTDDLFVKVFEKTADRIMDKTTTSADIIKWVVIGVVVVVAGIMIIRVMKTKRKHEKEKNEETERILNTPLGSSATDDLADKYTDSGTP